MDSKVKIEYAYKVALNRVVELEKNLILKEALIAQYKDEIERLTNLVNKNSKEDSEVS